jgi:HPt (histidine-containing phosphotransfer) domain-containing protein
MIAEPQEPKVTDEAAADPTLDVRPDPDLQDLIPTFLENRRQELADIFQATERRDYGYIGRMAHTWKGVCRPYGFIHLETLSRQLEIAGETQDHAAVEGILSRIRDHLDHVRIRYT